MIVIKVLIGGIIVSVISVCVQMIVRKINFLDTLINFARKLGEKETVSIVIDLNGHVESNAEGY